MRRSETAAAVIVLVLWPVTLPLTVLGLSLLLTIKIIEHH
jgi:hypothetical protein